MATQNRPPNIFRRQKKREPLDTYAIFEKPLDYPDKFVVRRFVIDGMSEEPIPDKEVQLASTLEEARSKVPQGLHRIERQTEDPPYLVETWL